MRENDFIAIADFDKDRRAQIVLDLRFVLNLSSHPLFRRKNILKVIRRRIRTYMEQLLTKLLRYRVLVKEMRPVSRPYRFFDVVFVVSFVFVVWPWWTY